MRLLSVLALSILALLLPSPARATTIDDFVLKGEGQIVTFSLPATIAGAGSYGAGGSDGGFFANPSNLKVDGVSYTVTGMQVFSRNFPTPGESGGFSFATPARTYTIVGTVLYTGSSNDATFLNGTFNLFDFYTPFGTIPNSPYVLTITPEASSVPEPSSWLLMLTGCGALAVLSTRNRVQPIV